MKIPYIVRVLGLLAIITAGSAVGDRAVAQPGMSVSFQTFYSDLSPYGRWTSHPQYGSIWIPSVVGDFQPYATNGRWVVTEYGNTWVSDYDWGWAPFHYGRWFHDDFYGWAWVPDYEWGPAWVNWRSGGGYYGWAPLSPGIHINVQVNIPMNYWVFVPQVYITSPRLYNYCLPRTRVVNVYNQTTIINNYYNNDNRTYVYGPRRNEIERVTRNTVPVYRADEVVRPARSRYENDRDNNRTYSADVNSNRARTGARQDEVYSNDRTPSRSNRESTSGIIERNSTDRNYGSTTEPGRARRSYEEAAPGRYGTDTDNQAERSTRSRSSADWSDATRSTPTPDYTERSNSSRSRQSGVEADRTPYGTNRSSGTYDTDRTAPSSRSYGDRSYGTSESGRARSSYGESNRSSAPATRTQPNYSPRSSGAEMSAPRSRSNQSSQGSYQSQPQRQSSPSYGGDNGRQASGRQASPRSSRSRGVE
ncbi:DUF6600 domain-containing protein [Telluribacter sp. SYSU D00476]|uniref:DUF6600 domain-containing protein n=1 Tax=Telluribacter sp. SYSU D00476 TaxID=2811430 RepID=UPI001FF11EFB|nr:DUF6600 domain-containing protein [Telluribacter sp. SYSU D00476]